MLKQVFKVLLILIFAPLSLLADPIDWLSPKEAKAVVEYLKKNPYIVDYCDCCDAPEGALIRVTSTKVVPSPYGDDGSYSVEITGEVVFYGKIQNGTMVGLEERSADSPLGNVTMNYHWAYTNGKIRRMGAAVDYSGEYDFDCENQLTSFPSASDYKSKNANVSAYKKWYKKTVKMK